MRKLTIILTFFWTINCSGQVEKRVNDILARKDFIQFKNYIDSLHQDSLSSPLNRTLADWTYLREITKGYQEGVLFIHKMIQSKMSKTTGREWIYRVRLLTTDNQIIYYELTEEKNKRQNGEWVPYYKPIDSFKNDSLFKTMTASFQQAFQTTLDETALFLTTIYYGCAIPRNESNNSTYRNDKLALVKLLGGDPHSKPTESAVVDKFVQDNDKPSLMQWLQSTNTEKQIYAVYGFYRLKQDYGISPTDRESQLINAVLQKKGTMLTRCGCEFGYEDISIVTDKLKFQ